MLFLFLFPLYFFFFAGLGTVPFWAMPCWARCCAAFRAIAQKGTVPNPAISFYLQESSFIVKIIFIDLRRKGGIPMWRIPLRMVKGGF